MKAACCSVTCFVIVTDSSMSPEKETFEVNVQKKGRLGSCACRIKAVLKVLGMTVSRLSDLTRLTVDWEEPQSPD